MRRRELITLFGGAIASLPLAARAQQPDRTRLIGLLMGNTESDLSQQYLAAFRHALSKLGWMEASNLQIAVRWGDPIPHSSRATLLS